MKKLLWFGLAMTWISVASALPSTEAAKALLEQDPVLQGARAELEATQLEARNVKASPYEWTVEATGQRRRYDSGGVSSNEWNAGLQRGVRWPNKVGLDHRLGETLQQEAEWRYQKAREESARDLLTLWLDWAQARTKVSLLEQQQALAQENVDIVGKRVRAGDAAAQEAGLAQGESANLASQLAAARLEAREAELALTSRFPGIALNDAALPDPEAPVGSPEDWRQRLLSANSTLALAQLQAQRAGLAADRAAAERLPDPTLGVFTASEARNTENIVGISVSMPLTGGRRLREAKRARAEATATALTTRTEMLRAQQQAAQRWQVAMDSVAIWRLSEQSATAQRESAQRGQRAFQLGEGSQQDLLLLRRQALSAAETALAARVAALRAVQTLAIDAHQGWLADDVTPSAPTASAP